MVAGLAAEGLLLRHYAAIATLEHRAPCAQSDLAKAMGWDPADAVGILRTLDERGLVTRDRDPADRRRHVLRLTPAGLSAVQRCHELAARAQEELLAPLDPAEREELRRLLGRLG